MLLKKRDFRGAFVRFDMITKVNPNLKGAWLNRGYALGKLGDVDKEIESYKKVLNKPEKYERALHNEKIAKRIKRIKNARRWIKNVVIKTS